MKAGEQFELPKKSRKSFVEFVNDLNYWWIIAWAIALYIGPALLFSGIEYFFGGKAHLITTQTSVDFWDLLYFNFVSMLTIGYGDMSPVGIFRIFTLLEAILGIAIFTFSISFVTTKLLLPRRNSIIFSKYAYFCTDDNSFLIIYLNVSSQFITNLETSWYFKLNEDWQTRTPVRVPFITQSVQTFYLHFEKDLLEINATLHPYDCLRVGLSGNVGMAAYSTYVQYNVDEILVIRNRNELKKYEGFYSVAEHISTEAFHKYFHYHPQGAYPLSSCLASAMNIHRKA